MTLPNLSQPTTSTAVWTRDLDQVDVEATLQQPRATREHVSHSCCTEPALDLDPTLDTIVTITTINDAQTEADNDAKDKLNDAKVEWISPAPSVTPQVQHNGQTNCDYLPILPRNGTTDQTLLLQQMQQSKQFSLFCYFSTPAQKMISKKRRKKKVRIPAKQLLYYTKV